MSKSVKKGLLAVGVLALTTSASAGALTENVSFELGDVNYIFGGMVVAGVALYAIRKAKKFTWCLVVLNSILIYAIQN